MNVYRRRLIVIGPDRVGKSSLKKNLLGLPFDPKEQSTEGIEVNASQCQIEVEQVKNWHPTHENKPGLLECSKDIAKVVTEKLCQNVRLDLDSLDFQGESDFEEESDFEDESDLASEDGIDSKKDQVYNSNRAFILVLEIIFPAKQDICPCKSLF